MEILVLPDIRAAYQDEDGYTWFYVDVTENGLRVLARQADDLGVKELLHGWNPDIPIEAILDVAIVEDDRGIQSHPYVAIVKTACD